MIGIFKPTLKYHINKAIRSSLIFFGVSLATSILAVYVPPGYIFFGILYLYF